MRLSQAEWERLRDEFAGQAMAAMLMRTDDVDFDELAREAYQIADAMLAERGNHPGPATSSPRE